MMKVQCYQVQDHYNMNLTTETEDEVKYLTQLQSQLWRLTKSSP